MGSSPTKADPDVWLRPVIKVGGFEYFELVLCYVDDILSMSADPESTLRGLQSAFKLKDDKIAEPNVYLGAQMGKMIADGHECWTISAEKYVLALVRDVEEALGKKGLWLPSKCYTPLPPDFWPELDTSSELRAMEASYGGWLSSEGLTFFWRLPCCRHTWYCPVRVISIRCTGYLVISNYIRRENLRSTPNIRESAKRRFECMSGTTSIAMWRKPFPMIRPSHEATLCQHIVSWMLVTAVTVPRVDRRLESLFSATVRLFMAQ